MVRVFLIVMLYLPTFRQQKYIKLVEYDRLTGVEYDRLTVVAVDRYCSSCPPPTP